MLVDKKRQLGSEEYLGSYEPRRLAPEQTFWTDQLGEFVLPYEAVRLATDSEKALSAFLQSTFNAAVELANWDLMTLERRQYPGTWRPAGVKASVALHASYVPGAKNN